MRKPYNSYPKVSSHHGMPYYYDVLQGHHAIFEQAGFEVVTNGYIGDFDFVEIFYDTIRRFRYTTSNHTGSYAYYSLEMGIPFFLYGKNR